MKRLSCFTSLLLLWIVGAPAGAQKLPERLERVEEDLAETREAMEVTETRQSSLLGEIERLDQALARRRRELESVEDDLEDALRQERQARERAKGIEREVESLRRSALDRLRALHRLALRGWGPVLLHAPEDLADALRYRRYLSAILEADRRLLDELSERRREASQAREAARKAARELREARSRKETSLRQVRAALDDKETLLASVRDQASRQRAMVEELETTEERLRKELAHTRAAGTRPSEFVSPLDVAGASLREARNGIEIPAEEGTPIRAVADGRVVFADWFPGYGRMVIVEHGGHLHSIYGYAGVLRVSRGDHVGQGDPIAEVGRTGAAREAALYLEIRVRGEPKDPKAYISLR